MAHSRLTKFGVELTKREVVPVLSKDRAEARRRVLSVYKKLQRYVPTIWWDFRMRDIPLPQFRASFKNEFVKNAHITDTRVIDRLVQKAELDIINFRMAFYNPEHVRNYLFRENIEAKPVDFLSRFFANKD